MIHNKEQDFLTVPAAIVIAGIIVALSIFLGASKIAASFAGSAVKSVATTTSVPSSAVAAGSTAIKVVPFNAANDHYLGNPKAKVAIIEYSDTECPYCKQFDPVLHKLMDNYGDQVVWVYRHMPLAMHPKAPHEAEATECAAEQGGNDAFWKYLSRIYAVTPSNNGLDPAQLPEIAKYVGLDAAKFQTCLDSGKYAAKIAAMSAEGAAAGGRGTPYGIIVGLKGNTPINGSLSYEALEAMVKTALGK